MTDIQDVARTVRALILKSSTAAGTGHPTSSLSAADLMVELLFNGHFKTDLKNPEAPYNDRLIFSKGHASPLFYSLYTVAGAVTVDELMTFRDIASPLEGHPTREFAYTEVPTGSLGQGLGIGLGMTLQARIDQLSYKTWVLLGDSELAEGSVWEAAQVASYYNMSNLIAIVDANRLGQRGETMVGHETEVYSDRFSAFGWNVIHIDGHDYDHIEKAYQTACNRNNNKPTAIIAKTYKGAGISFLEDKENWHGKALSAEDLEKALTELGEHNIDLKATVEKPKKSKPHSYRPDLIPFEFPEDKYSTRQAYGEALSHIHYHFPEMVVIDAETSNSTFAATFAQHYPSRFIEAFIAEQNMVSMAVGMARRGKKPFISTFAAFLTRAFDQLRMAQYAHVPLNVVGSHSGVSIGPDGASQMALEDIAMMRSIGDSVVLYPSDAISTIKCLELMAQRESGVSYMRTTRAKTGILYPDEEEFVIGGSKTIRTDDQDKVTIIAAGITLHEAIKAADSLEAQGIFVRVIDLYSIKPIDTGALEKACAETEALVVVEDHRPEGGLFEAVCSSGVIDKPVYSLAVHIEPHSGTPEELLRMAEIDAQAIVEKVKNILN